MDNYFSVRCRCIYCVRAVGTIFDCRETVPSCFTCSDLCCGCDFGVVYSVRIPLLPPETPQTVEEQWLFSSIVNQSTQAANEKSVGIREQDLHADSRKMAGVEKLHGYEYFNALFFLSTGGRF